MKILRHFGADDVPKGTFYNVTEILQVGGFTEIYEGTKLVGVVNLAPGDTIDFFDLTPIESGNTNV